VKAKILCLQFRKKEQSIAKEQASIAREVGEFADPYFVSALDSQINWEDPAGLLSSYGGVILGGSGDFDFDGGRSDDDEAKKISYEILDRLRPLFSYIFDHDIPTLGICYGHQLVGAFAGAQVVNDHEQKKTRSHQVRLLTEAHEHFLFSGLPNEFFAHYGHKDSLDRIPEGATLLIEGGRQCRVSALKYKNNIYTTQFHPELTGADMIERIKNAPGYLPEGQVVEELFKDDPNSNLILCNFAQFVQNQARFAGYV
jgi:GMP synthase (glutamine-hydrolysing)